MSPQMTEYFRRKLLKWRSELLQESEETLQSLQEGGLQEADIADRASLETGDPISIRRLEARPIATLSLEAQERHERLERTHRDD